MKDYSPWQYEYCYFKNPKMTVTKENYTQIMTKMKNLDFNSASAKAFKAGWNACLTLVEERMNDCVEELDK